MGRAAAFVISLAFMLGALVTTPMPSTPYRMVTRDYPLARIAVIGDSYTNGTDIGGRGPSAWTSVAWQTLQRQGLTVQADVAAEGRAGYGVRGDHGSLFADLTARAVRPDDSLIVFFGSRNDQGVAPQLLTALTHDALAQARRTAPSARLLVIGPPWPTADVPGNVLQIRDILNGAARSAGAAFVDPIGAGWFVGRPDLIGGDGVHPNDAGHAYMAGKIAPLIAAQLPRRL